MIRPLIIDKLQHRSATQGAVQYELLSDWIRIEIRIFRDGADRADRSINYSRCCCSRRSGSDLKRRELLGSGIFDYDRADRDPFKPKVVAYNKILLLRLQSANYAPVRTSEIFAN
jgi:hypothetical protein